MNCGKSYTIGEVAELLGVSRDTLRIYEENGLIAPVRWENGYRLYRDDDICGLISVKFHRMNSIPMKEIKQIIDTRGKGFCACGETSKDIIKRRIEAEELEIMRHKKNAERLRLALRYYDEDGGPGGAEYLIEICMPVRHRCEQIE